VGRTARLPPTAPPRTAVRGSAPRHPFDRVPRSVPSGGASAHPLDALRIPRRNARIRDGPREATRNPGLDRASTAPRGPSRSAPRPDDPRTTGARIRTDGVSRSAPRGLCGAIPPGTSGVAGRAPGALASAPSPVDRRSESLVPGPSKEEGPPERGTIGPAPPPAVAFSRIRDALAAPSADKRSTMNLGLRAQPQGPSLNGGPASSASLEAPSWVRWRPHASVPRPTR
jgi:hypothetical protein